MMIPPTSAGHAIAFIPLAFFLNVLSLPLCSPSRSWWARVRDLRISWKTVYVAVTAEIRTSSELAAPGAVDSSVGGPAIGGVLIRCSSPLPTAARCVHGSALLTPRNTRAATSATRQRAQQLMTG